MDLQEFDRLAAIWAAAFGCECDVPGNPHLMRCTSCRSFWIVRKYVGPRGLQVILGEAEPEPLSAA
jgi:hypothetical protein